MSLGTADCLLNFEPYVSTWHISAPAPWSLVNMALGLLVGLRESLKGRRKGDGEETREKKKTENGRG